MKRRGLRLEVDEPTERQQRNARWAADHPGACAAAGAVLFAVLGLVAYDAIGALVGVVLGGIVGWGFSVENTRETPRGTKLVLYVAGTAVVFAALFVLRSR